jgi:hypothetical protein
MPEENGDEEKEDSARAIETRLSTVLIHGRVVSEFQKYSEICPGSAHDRFQRDRNLPFINTLFLNVKRATRDAV